MQWIFRYKTVERLGIWWSGGTALRTICDCWGCKTEDGWSVVWLLRSGRRSFQGRAPVQWPRCLSSCPETFWRRHAHTPTIANSGLRRDFVADIWAGRYRYDRIEKRALQDVLCRIDNAILFSLFNLVMASLCTAFQHNTGLIFYQRNNAHRRMSTKSVKRFIEKSIYDLTQSRLRNRLVQL
jgi:hypothetical protein